MQAGQESSVQHNSTVDSTRQRAEGLLSRGAVGRGLALVLVEDVVVGAVVAGQGELDVLGAQHGGANGPAVGEGHERKVGHGPLLRAAATAMPQLGDEGVVQQVPALPDRAHAHHGHATRRPQKVLHAKQ